MPLQVGSWRTKAGSPANTPTDRGINKIIRQLNTTCGLHLPETKHAEAPVHYAHTSSLYIVPQLKFLYHREPAALYQTIQDFIENAQSPHRRHYESEYKTQLLRDMLVDQVKLAKARKRSSGQMHAKLQQSKGSPPSRADSVSSEHDQMAYFTAPDSPTLRGKHVPNTQVEEIDQIVLPGTTEADLKEAFIANRHQKYSRVLSFTDSTPEGSGITTMNTSFTTSVGQSEGTTALTSFTSDFQARMDCGDAEPASSMSYGTIDSLSLLEIENLDAAMRRTSGTGEGKRQVPHSEDTYNERVSKALKLALEDHASVGAQPPEDPFILPSDGRVHYRITEMRRMGFGDHFSRSSAKSRGFEIEVEASRLARAYSTPAEELVHVQTPQDIQRFIQSSASIGFRPSGRNVWQEAMKGPREARILLSGTMKLNRSKDGPLVRMDLLPLRVDNNGCRVTRRFGWDRMLVITADFFDQPPAGLRDKANKEAYREAGLHWLNQEHKLCGRVWRAFCIKTPKDKRDKKRSLEAQQVDQDGSTRTFKVFLFALRGHGISENILFEDFLDWHLRFQVNQNQNVCKLFSRLELAVSGIVPTVDFDWRQVQEIKDVPANGEIEDEIYTHNELLVTGDAIRDPQPGAVMTDGCGIISVGAAKLVVEKYPINNARPSVFQFRCNGAKGLCSISAPYDTLDPKHLDLWIKVRPSQRKIEIHPDDLSDTTCENQRWSLDVVSFTGPPRRATISRDLLTILAANGVPWDTLKTVLEECLVLDIDGSTESIEDNQIFACWVQEHQADMSGFSHHERSDFFRSTTARVSLMLSYGFNPTTNGLLAEAVIRLLKYWLTQIRTNFRIDVPQSTKVKGIADPSATETFAGVLKPGEVHLAFSEPLRDARTGESWSVFHGSKAIVARTPCLAEWDAQAVTIVQKPELMHIKDTIVMSARGKMSLAAKLQGGDYDGDTFWVCWDSRLTGPFRNAPVRASPPISAFGIEKVNSTLHDITGGMKPTLDHVNAWLKSMWSFMLSDDLLGFITNYYYRYTYQEPDITTSKAHAIVHLHGHIIDSQKQGYRFDHRQFLLWLKQQGLPLPRRLSTPPYMRAKQTQSRKHETTCFDQSPASRNKNKLLDLADAIVSPRKSRRANNILDFVLQEVIDPAIKNGLDRVGKLLANAGNMMDPELESPLEEALHSTADKPESRAVLEAEQKHIIRELDEIHKLWAKHSSKKGADFVQACVRPCKEHYDQIWPENPDHPFIVASQLGKQPSFWEQLKASILYKNFHRKPLFMYSIAIDTLGFIKASSVGGVTLDAKFVEICRPKRPRSGKAASAKEAWELEEESSVNDVNDDFDDGLEDRDFWEYMETE